MDVNKLACAMMVEFKKFFRSRIPFMTLLASVLIPLVGGLFMFILKDPALAQKMGMISAKAQLAGKADWPSYLGFLAQAVSVGGLIIFGFVTSWVFGREYADRTLKDLLALPTSRTTIVLAKFGVIVVWCIFLCGIVSLLGFAIGQGVNLPPYPPEMIRMGLFVFWICALLTVLLSTPVAFFACIGRGYLSPLGFIVLMIVMAQIVAVLGYGPYFPWAIPALGSRAAAGTGAVMEYPGIILVALTGLIGLIATVFWWRFVDQN